MESLIFLRRVSALAVVGTAFIGSAGIMFLFGLGLYYSSINPLLKKPGAGMSTLMFTLGLSILINNLLLQAFGPRIKHIPKFLSGVLKIGYLRISWHDIGLIIIIALFFIAFMLLIKYTWFGRAVRAVSEDMDGAHIVGIDVHRTYGLTFGVGMAVAGFSGSLRIETLGGGEIGPAGAVCPGGMEDRPIPPPSYPRPGRCRGDPP